MPSQIHPIKPLKIAALLSPSQNIADTILSYLSLLLSHTSSEQRNDVTTAFTVPPTGKGISMDSSTPEDARPILSTYHDGARWMDKLVDAPRRGATHTLFHI
jgi:hypothetical protein